MGNWKNHFGFTLIEVMVTVSLMSILFFVGMPLTKGWTTNTEVTSSKGVLTQAIGRAKSLAARNQMGVDSGNAASAICFTTDKKVQVRYATTSATTTVNCAASNTSTLDWSAPISANLTFNVSNTALSCICFDSKAQIITTASGCTSCAASTAITISATGIENETVSIY